MEKKTLIVSGIIFILLIGIASAGFLDYYGKITATVTILPRPIIEATIDIDPDTLNLNSEGNFVTVYIYIELPSPYNVSSINISTIKMYNSTGSFISALSFPSEIGDYDNNGIQDLMVKFDREEVKGLVPTDVDTDVEKTLTIKGGLLTGIQFEGSDTIRVINPAESQ